MVSHNEGGDRSVAATSGCNDSAKALHEDAFSGKADTIISKSVWRDLSPDVQSKTVPDARGYYVLPDLGLGNPGEDKTPRHKPVSFSDSFPSDNHGDIVVDDSKFYVGPLVETQSRPATAGLDTNGGNQALDDLDGLPEFKNRYKDRSNVLEVVRKRTEGSAGSYTETWQRDGSLLRVSKDNAADGRPLSVQRFHYDDNKNLTKMTSELSTGYRESYTYEIVRHADGTITSERQSAEIRFPKRAEPVKHSYSRTPEGQLEDKFVPN
jgi:hypothetical protein